MKTTEQAPTKFRVWNIINPPNPPNHHYVQSPEEGAKLISSIADAQLKIRSIYSNAFGLEIFENGEWEEWYSDEGEDIDQYFERLHPSA